MKKAKADRDQQAIRQGCRCQPGPIARCRSLGVRLQGSTPLIYLDNNATTPIDPDVADAMAACHRAQWANPASQHAAGRLARRVLEEAREGIASLLGASTSGQQADRVLFTSGGTEANNLVLRGLAASRSGHLLVSAIEHPSIAEPARATGSVRVWPVLPNGSLQLAALDTLLTDTKLVSVMLGNHETGGTAARGAGRAGVPAAGNSHPHRCRPGCGENCRSISGSWGSMR